VAHIDVCVTVSCSMLLRAVCSCHCEPKAKQSTASNGLLRRCAPRNDGWQPGDCYVAALLAMTGVLRASR